MSMIGTELFTGPLVAAFFIGITSVILLYWYSTRNHDYWKKRGVPYAKPVLFLGSVLENSKAPLHDVELQRYIKYGRIYGHFEANRPLLSVGDPVLLRDIFVKDFQFFPNRRSISTGDQIADSFLSNKEGEDWKRVRTIVTPTFSTGKIKRMIGIFKDCSRTLVENFKKSTVNGTPVEAKTVYGAFTMDIIASSAFSTKLDSHNDPDNMFVKAARTVFSQNVSWRIILFFLFPGISKMFRISLISPAATGFFREVTLQIIKERKRTGQKRNDFLQLLMDTAKEISQEQKGDGAEKDNEDIALNYAAEETGTQVFKNVSNKNLSIDELVAQCVIFFLAGYDTTATTLSFVTYLLALHPEIQDKVHAEIDAVLKESKGELTYDAIQSMKYLDNVMSETLRLYPPAIRIERVADADYKLGDTGITIPKGMIVTIPSYAIQRDPKLYPDPEKFDPDRFSAEERGKRNQYAFLPFGAGPRNCVGMRFALMEIKVCLVYVLSAFIVKRCPQTKVPLDYYIGQGLLQPKEIMVEMELRKDNPLVE